MVSKLELKGRRSEDLAHKVRFVHEVVDPQLLCAGDSWNESISKSSQLCLDLDFLQP